ncbi:MAG: hypothetical protein B6I24_11485 [Bacteroidetes bacterium 4572_128]|nr:MAG: hypothetical protein B6I24_11485 [Bacteroidetes bacterium 4572_128]
MEEAFVGATGTIFGVGTANIWNPIGWALIVASVGAGFVTLFFREKQKNKIAIAKKEAKKQLISSINQAKYDIYEKFKITLSEICFRKNINKKLMTYLIKLNRLL